MKETDDTPVPESKSEDEMIAYTSRKISYLENRIAQLELRISELEVQRVANESNQDDPEWYA